MQQWGQPIKLSMHESGGTKERNVMYYSIFLGLLHEIVYKLELHF